MSALAPNAIPRCPHFGSCGGCQHQDLAYDGQLRLKRSRLEDLLQQESITAPEIAVHAAQAYGYRNRIRLRIQRDAVTLRFGYNVRATTEFLPIAVCPIAAPLLLQTVEVLLALASTDRDAEHWLNAAAEVELFTNHDLSRVQGTLFCAPRTKAPQGSLTRLFNALHEQLPQVAGLAAAAFDPRTGPTGRTIAEAGATGLTYRVGAIDYWVSRGSFFQVNRFLLETLVSLVCTEGQQPRSGTLAWDLFSGVGLFSRVLAQSFQQITAVEANPIAIADLTAALRKSTVVHELFTEDTLVFLRSAVMQRERPDLVVLDPPRAGAGTEACALLNRIAPPAIVYVSCDPVTLVRDLAVLQAHYRITSLHMVDLFPQTSHVETVAILTKSK